MNKEHIGNIIDEGKTSLGIELGSTRIKAVLIDDCNEPIASGSFEWNNILDDQIWTYKIGDIWEGISESYKELKKDVMNQYQVHLKKVGSLGISAMMHGYLAFDKNDRLLVPFRTWRNNITGQASSELSELFNYPIPQRWSIAHLYQASINKEEHVKDISYITTLAGYVHWMLTGEKVLGVGDASGMFPIELSTKKFNLGMLSKYDELLINKQYSWTLPELLPKVLIAGENAGNLSDIGAKRLDPSGDLISGVPCCPPEGDAGTGMVATNSVAVRTGNVSAGTSVFAMVVLEKELEKLHSEIDLVTTPSGKLVAMAHSNNCTTELNSWVGIFGETLKTFGVDVSGDELYGKLYQKALEGDPDCGGLLSYGYHSGEHITHFEEGRPLLVRRPESNFNLANLVKVNLYTALGALKTGLDILTEDEEVKVDVMLGHGGLFKTESVGQQIMADAIGVPVTVMKTAGEGGAWGIALLASYLINNEGKSLDLFLKDAVFSDEVGSTLLPSTKGMEGFKKFMNRYSNGLEIERAAIKHLKN